MYVGRIGLLVLPPLSSTEGRKHPRAREGLALNADMGGSSAQNYNESAPDLSELVDGRSQPPLLEDEFLNCACLRGTEWSLDWKVPNWS